MEIKLVCSFKLVEGMIRVLQTDKHSSKNSDVVLVDQSSGSCKWISAHSCGLTAYDPSLQCIFTLQKWVKYSRSTWMGTSPLVWSCTLIYSTYHIKSHQSLLYSCLSVHVIKKFPDTIPNPVCCQFQAEYKLVLQIQTIFLHKHSRKHTPSSSHLPIPFLFTTLSLMKV